MSRLAAAVLVIALIATNAVWLYFVVNTSVAVEHHATEVTRQRNRVALLTSLFHDYPRDSDAAGAFETLRTRYPDRILKLHGDTLEVDDIAFRHQDGKLVAVKPF